MSVAEASGKAMARAAAQVMGSIRETTGVRPEQKSPYELVVDEYVRVAGHWWRFGGLMDDGRRMVLWSLEGATDPFVYGPTHGELFVWQEPAF